jgi:hypothetical protein
MKNIRIKPIKDYEYYYDLEEFFDIDLPLKENKLYIYKEEDEIIFIHKKWNKHINPQSPNKFLKI